MGGDHMKNLLEKYLKLLNEENPKESPVGKHNDVPDDKFDLKELKNGIDIEKEHTNNPEIAKRIAKDHLSEIPDYYTRLKKMESEAKGGE
jgi:hypothetical protein